MDALSILRNIIEDGFLSETNKHRGRALLDRIDQVHVTQDVKSVLLECRAQYASGDAVNAIKRYRAAAGCGLREAHDAVKQATV